jgi:hypothetical protein
LQLIGRAAEISSIADLVITAKKVGHEAGFQPDGWGGMLEKQKTDAKDNRRQYGEGPAS